MASSSGSQAVAGAAAAPAANSRAKNGAFLLACAALLAGGGCLAWQQLRADPWLQGYRVVKEYHHDPGAYCQGLVFDDGVLHESTGRNGESSVRTVELETGKVLHKTDLPYEYFGEGLAQVGDRLIQITWKEQVARIYDKNTLTALDQFQYEGEGWGLAFDGTNLVMSNGSPVLVFRDPKTFKEVRRVTVKN